VTSRLLAASVMADVFISYSRRDEEFVLTIARALEERSKDVWRDKEDIPPAVAWEEEIRRGIDASDVFVYVLSPDSLASTHCGDELDHALGRNKTIVPLMRREPDGAVVPDALARLNYVFARDGDDFDVALAALLAAVDGLPEHARLHTRVLARAAEWEAGSRDSSRLLSGRELRDADEWLARAAGKDPPPTPLHHEYILASRKRASRRQRVLVGLALAAAAVTAVLAVVALLQRNEAQRQRDEAVRQARISASRALAAQAKTSLDHLPALGALLALEAFGQAETFEARDALVSAVQRTEWLDWIVPASATAVALGPDGNTLLTGRADGTVVVWDVERRQATGKPIQVSKTAVSRLVFAPGGVTFAVAGSRAEPVSLWNLEERRRLGELGKGEDADIAFSTNGRTIALVAGGRITLWNVGRRELLRRVGRFPTAGRVAFSPDGRMLASTEILDHRASPSDAVVRLWDAGTGRQLGKPLALAAPGFVPSRLAFSPDGRLLAAATLRDDLGNPGVFRVWDVSRREPLGEAVTAESAGVTAVAFSRDGKTLVSGADRVRTWTWSRVDGLSERPGSPFKGTVHTSDVAVGPGGLLVALGADGSVRVSGFTGAWTLGELLTKGASASTALSGDGTVLAAATLDGAITLWDVASRRTRGAPLRTGTESAAIGTEFGTVALSADGKTVAFGDWNGRLTLWQGAARRSTQKSSGLDEISSFALTPNANALVAFDFAGRAAFLPLDGEARPIADAGVSAVAFSAAGDTLALGADDGTISFRDGAGRRLGKAVGAHSGPVSSLAFSRDGHTLASGGEGDGTVRLWDVAHRVPMGTALKVDDAGISSLAFAPDGTTVAVGIKNLSFILWDLAQRRPVGQPLRIGDYTPIAVAAPNPDLDTSVSFSRDGRTLAAEAGSTVALWKQILWSREAAPFRERLCHLVGRNLTAAEWRTFLPQEPHRKTCSQWPAATR